MSWTNDTREVLEKVEYEGANAGSYIDQALDQLRAINGRELIGADEFAETPGQGIKHYERNNLRAEQRRSMEK